MDWTPPMVTFIKTNIDASYSEHLGFGSTQVVLWDHTRALIRAQALWYQIAQSVRSMEDLATKDVIRLALDLGLRKVIVESDAQGVVWMVNAKNFKRT